MTKLFAWLTGCLLAASVMISLVFVTRDRDELRQILGNTNSGLVCRYSAAAEVNQALADEQVALAEHSVLIGEFLAIIIRIPVDDPARVEPLAQLAGKIEAVDMQLRRDGELLQEAVDRQREALRDCNLG